MNWCDIKIFTASFTLKYNPTKTKIDLDRFWIEQIGSALEILN